MDQGVEEDFRRKKLNLITDFVDVHGTLNDDQLGDAIEQKDVEQVHERTRELAQKKWRNPQVVEDIKDLRDGLRFLDEVLESKV